MLLGVIITCFRPVVTSFASIELSRLMMTTTTKKTMRETTMTRVALERDGAKLYESLRQRARGALVAQPPIASWMAYARPRPTRTLRALSKNDLQDELRAIMLVGLEPGAKETLPPLPRWSARP